MRTDVSVTSIVSFYNLNLGAKQYEIASAVRDLQGRGTPVSCENICKHLGYTPNRVTGRLKELRAKGAIEYDGFTTSSFGRNVETYRLITKGQGAML